MKALVGVLSLCLALAGCRAYSTAVGSAYVRAVRPLPCQEGYRCLEYHFLADDHSVMNAEEQEARRVEWIRQSLRSNGCEAASMEVLDRQIVLPIRRMVGMSTQDIYYRVRAPKLE